jgi:hypothetical protein
MRQTLLRVGERISPAPHHDQRFRMNARAAARVWNLVTVNRREPHWPQYKPASSRVRVSPAFAFALTAASVAWRMHRSQATPISWPLVATSRSVIEDTDQSPYRSYSEGEQNENIG